MHELAQYLRVDRDRSEECGGTREEAEEEKEVVVEEDMSAKTKARLLSRARAVTREA